MGSGRFLGLAWHYIDLVHIFPCLFARNFFPSISACRHSVTFLSPFYFSSLLLLISLFFFFFFFFSLPLFLFSFTSKFSHLWRRLYFFFQAFFILLPAISTECSHFHTISYCIPLVSFVELSLQLHDPSKFKYLATSCQKVASMVPTARGGSRVLRPQCVSITELHIALHGRKIKAELRKPTDTQLLLFEKIGVSNTIGCAYP
ncbi:hypothetical protein BO79DRAFT_68982 [Aspergillus costaricaensis CBS 115574]|uniref:Uncharacterized protein n=1 Tax=Aspergillus costaricaensis CBS 115574 TaxID=1448317 RepID=A0ACD1HYP5_9EURO|nr:hypothetical protein BO79DRAFT_68982 [Aspergillus costaricaensis CBS 115574]RAK83330.1 hypothetical protein BO79DRAFT_68982 [Aspergillus costaricaensis CBS 115574]